MITDYIVHKFILHGTAQMAMHWFLCSAGLEDGWFNSILCEREKNSKEAGCRPAEQSVSTSIPVTTVVDVLSLM